MQSTLWKYLFIVIFSLYHVQFHVKYWIRGIIKYWAAVLSLKAQEVNYVRLGTAEEVVATMGEAAYVISFQLQVLPHSAGITEFFCLSDFTWNQDCHIYS